MSWMDSQLAGPDGDKLMTVAANALVDESPQDAVTVASGISDPAQSGRLQKRFLRDWSDEDPEASSAWAREAGLPDPAVRRDN